MIDPRKYTITGFGNQLKKIRKVSGYSQQQAGALVGVKKSMWCAWEKETGAPNVRQFIIIARAFKVLTSYFFLEDAHPDAFRIADTQDEAVFFDKLIGKTIAFAETDMAKFVFSRLSDLMIIKSLGFFHVYPHCGTTTLLNEFTCRESNALLVENYTDFNDINSRIIRKLNFMRADKNIILIFDKAELLSPATLTEICRSYAPVYSLAFFSIDNSLLDDMKAFAFATYQLPILTAPDFTLIAGALFPNANTEALAMLALLTQLDLMNLYKFRVRTDGAAIITRDHLDAEYKKTTNKK